MVCVGSKDPVATTLDHGSGFAVCNDIGVLVRLIADEALDERCTPEAKGVTIEC